MPSSSLPETATYWLGGEAPADRDDYPDTRRAFCTMFALAVLAAALSAAWVLSPSRRGASSCAPQVSPHPNPPRAAGRARLACPIAPPSGTHAPGGVLGTSTPTDGPVSLYCMQHQWTSLSRSLGAALPIERARCTPLLHRAA
eukprot:487013-Prymnesium_polylepis.1